MNETPFKLIFMQIIVEKVTYQNIDQFISLIHLFEEVFEMKGFKMPMKDYLCQLLKTETFMVFVATVDDEIVGGLTAYTLHQYYSEKPLVYIYDLAVKTAFQRKGVGKKLIATINKYCAEKGMEEVFVQADEIDEHAVEFYRSTGGIAEKVIHFYYPLN